MASKTYHIGDREEKLDHDYTIVVTENDNNTTYVLSRSESSHWSEHARGEELLTLVDDGNGYKFKEKIGRAVDYAQFAELYILIQFINKMYSNKPVYIGTISETTFITDF